MVERRYQNEIVILRLVVVGIFGDGRAFQVIMRQQDGFGRAGCPLSKVQAAIILIAEVDAGVGAVITGDRTLQGNHVIGGCITHADIPFHPGHLTAHKVDPLDKLRSNYHHPGFGDIRAVL
jgi:hypothetical protein